MADNWQWKGDAGLGAGNIVLPKGTPAVIITATITATLTGDTTYTSAETAIAGFNSILAQMETASGGRTVKLDIAGAMSSGGTMIAVYDKDTSAQMTVNYTANKTVRFAGLPDYLGFSATLSSGMTAGVSVVLEILPINL